MMKRPLNAPLLFPFFCLLIACGGDSAPAAEDTTTQTDDGLLLPDTTVPNIDTVESITQKTDWCDTALGTAVGTRPFAQDFARAHVGIRLFGPLSDWIQNDIRLSDLLKTEALAEPLLDAYASTSDEVCSVGYVEPGESPVSITIDGEVAVVLPGPGALEIPDEVSRVLLDLRDTSRLGHLRTTLEQLIPQSVTLGTRAQRRFHGFPSQGEGWTHFEVSHEDQALSLSGVASKDWVLAVLTGTQLTPEAATLIGGLRLANELTIMGYDVHSSVAESSWSGVGDGGLAWRSSYLTLNGNPWPDQIPADAEPASLDEAVVLLQNITSTPAIMGTASRSALTEYNREGLGVSDTLSQGTMKASLLVAYGTLDWFYPYFDVVGRDLDEALITALTTVDTLGDGDRVAFRNALGRFMHHLDDGHGFYSDYAREDWWDGYLAIQLQRVNEEPVVRSSAHPGINAGDTIVAIDGTDSKEWFEETMLTFSASSDGYRFVLAADALKEVYGSRTLTLRDPQGVERTDTFLPEPYETTEQVAWGGSLRESGWLGDLDAPGIFYVNMAASVTPDETPIVEQLAEIKSQASGMVLDMRDYPNLHIYEFARNFHTSPFTAPIFTFPTWEGASDFQWTEEIWDFLPADEVYTGPIALLVSNNSVSAAECFAQMIMNLENVTVVGQQSASTNGTITDVVLPGNFRITFTGMLLLSPDGSPFHGIGVVPDEDVVPTAEEFAAGTDPELIRAIDLIIGKSP